MTSILGITLPIFLLIALGWFAVSRGLFAKDETRAMGRLVLNFALPAVLFRAIAERPLGDVLSSRYLAAYTAGSLLVYFAALLLFRARGRRLDAAAMLALGISNANSAFIGLPIVIQFLGHGAAAAVAQTMLVENLVMMPVALGLAHAGAGTGARLLDIVRGAAANLVRTPIIVAIVVGALFSAVGLYLPVPLGRAVELLAGASTPVALFVIGGALVGLRPTGMRSDVAIISVGKLIVHPLAIAGGVLLFGVTDPLLAAAAIVVAASPMLSIYPLLGHRHGVEEVAAAALVTATVASFATINAVLWLLR